MLYKQFAANCESSHSVATSYFIILLFFALTYHHHPRRVAFFNWGDISLSLCLVMSSMTSIY
jgi:hypothetical protein